MRELVLLMLCTGAAWAEETEPPVAVNGDVKSFFVGTFPYDNALYQDFGILPADPTAQGSLDGRLKLSWKTPAFRFLVHHAVTAQTAPIARTTGQTGVGLQAPQAVDLGWRGLEEAESPDAMTLQGRTDRLSVSGDIDSFKWTIGRQPITLGHGLGFTPMDLVNPFFPTTVDQEYKPGVDAVLLDLFFGVSSKASLITAYTGDVVLSDADDWSVDGMVYALYAQHTLGQHDVGILVGEMRGDEVLGLTVATYAGPVGIHGDVTYTLPAEPDEEDPFVRGVVGALWTITPDVVLTAEVYHQSLGVTSPEDYLTQLESERFQRGELWLVGTTYASGTLAYQATPLIQSTATLIGNVVDGSALLAPGVTVSVSDEVQLVVGGFVGLGERPDELQVTDLLDPVTGFPIQGESFNTALGVNDEFGFYPSSAYVQMKAYF